MKKLPQRAAELLSSRAEMGPVVWLVPAPVSFPPGLIDRLHVPAFSQHMAACVTESILASGMEQKWHMSGP